MAERESLVGKMRKWLVTRIDQRMAEKLNVKGSSRGNSCLMLKVQQVHIIN